LKKIFKPFLPIRGDPCQKKSGNLFLIKKNNFSSKVLLSTSICSSVQSYEAEVLVNDDKSNMLMTKKETYEKKLQNIIDEIQFYEIYYKWSLIISITLIAIAMLSLCLYFVINSMKSNIFLRIYLQE
jgi:hypothetical protein